MHTRRTIRGLLLALGCMTLSVHAPLRAQAAELPLHTEGAVKYLNGGAGEEERALMRAHAREYPLQIVLSTPDGAYTVADSLTVANRHGELVSIKHAGPIVMLNLPPGRYSVEADINGVEHKRSVTIGQGLRQVHVQAPSTY